MIPQEELLSKPIKLRNCYLFYLGHIPNFLDVQLTRASDGIPTKPGYNIIFERGIDPDVDNPELCHALSEIPDSWPSVQEIVTFQKRVRERARSLYKIQATEINRKLGRALWISFEHEGRSDPRDLDVRLPLLIAYLSYASGDSFVHAPAK